jgi:excisionase family DNA binding protein
VTGGDDEAITLPLYSGPGRLDPGKGAETGTPPRGGSAWHTRATDGSPRLALPRPAAARSAPRSAQDRTLEPDLLTAEEAAAVLRTSRKAVYAMAERAQLPGIVRIGRRLLVRRADLLSWLNERRAASPGGTRR